MKIRFLLLSCFTLLLLESCNRLEEILYVDFASDFTMPSTVREGDTVRFSSGFSTTGAQRFSWDFGVANQQNDTSNQANPQFIYERYGKYRVSLKVEMMKSNGKQKSEKSGNIVVLPRTQDFPTRATFTFGEIGRDEVGCDIIPLNDGSGFAALSRRELNALFIVRTKLVGEQLVVEDTAQLDYLSNQLIVPRKIINTSDNGFLIVGYVQSSPVDNDAFILKLDEELDEEWFDFINSLHNETFVSAFENSNGNFVVVGTTAGGDIQSQNKVLIEEYTPDGAKLPSVLIGPNQNCRNCSAEQAYEEEDGNFIVVGTQGTQPLILRLNGFKDLLTKYNLAISGTAYDVTRLSDGKIAVVGAVNANPIPAESDRPNPKSGFVAKVNMISRTTEWMEQLALYDEYFVSVVEAPSVNPGGVPQIVALGNHYNPLSGQDVLLASYNSIGQLTQSQRLSSLRLYGGTENNEASKILYLPILKQYVVYGSTIPKLGRLNRRDVLSLILNQSLN